MKVALVLAPQYSPDFPYLAQGYLAAVLRRAGHAVTIIDGNIAAHAALAEKLGWLWSSDAVLTWAQPDSYKAQVWPHFESVLRAQLEQLVAGGFDVVGFSVFHTNYLSARWLLRQLHARQPGVKIVVGGPAVGLLPLKADYTAGIIDALVRGEGEVTMLDLVERAARGVSLRDAPGTLTGPARQPMDLAELPFPDLSDLAGLPYRSHQQPLQASRGCPFHCAFCVERTLWPGFRVRTPLSIADEMEHRYREHGANSFTVVDTLLNADVRWLDELASTIRERKMDVAWGGNLRVSAKMDQRLWGRLRQAGFNCAVLGVESGSQKVLRLMKKGIDPAVSLRNVRDCSTIGITTIVNILVGFPGESDADFEDTCRLIGRMWRHIDKINLSSFTPGPQFDDSIAVPVPQSVRNARMAALQPVVAELFAELQQLQRLKGKMARTFGEGNAKRIVMSRLRRRRRAVRTFQLAAGRELGGAA